MFRFTRNRFRTLILRGMIVLMGLALVIGPALANNVYRP